MVTDEKSHGFSNRETWRFLRWMNNSVPLKRIARYFVGRTMVTNIEVLDLIVGVELLVQATDADNSDIVRMGEDIGGVKAFRKINAFEVAESFNDTFDPPEFPVIP